MWWGSGILAKGFLQEGTFASGFTGYPSVNLVNGELHSSKMNAKMLVLVERRGRALTH